ncbi:MAG: HD domain-containing phosphohydrolase [Aminipila sp.]
MQNIILIVDDSKSNIKMAQAILETEYRVAAALSGEKALKFLEKTIPDLILLDINMPELSGFQVMEKLKNNEKWCNIPVIFLTADAEPQVEAECFKIGAIDFIRKPFVPEVIKNRIKRTLELQEYRKGLENSVKIQYQKILQQNEEIKLKHQQLVDIQQEVIISLANLIEGRDDSTGEHIKRTSQYVELIAKRLKEKGLFKDILNDDYIENLCKAAPMHDIGKICISDTILKKPGKLTDEEFEYMKKHAEEGGNIITNIMGKIEDQEFIDVAFDIATYHHEKWNGTGYPKALVGEEIPLSARVMAVADVFDALISKRCYKEPISISESFAIIEESIGIHFDPQVANAFIEQRKTIEALLKD